MSELHNVVLRIEKIDSIEYYVLYDRDKNMPLGRMPVDYEIGMVKDEEKLTPMERAVYDIYELDAEIINNPDDGSWEGR
tara:strand:- start:3184 stop:3420 length:237 start_codon:yes stop_codon:yes gene_type:complete